MYHPPVFRNMNFPAPAAVVGFLGAIADLVLSALTAATFLFLGKARWARRVGVLVGAGAIFYFVLLFGMSLASQETTVAPGQEKYFCEIDCHLAYSVLGSREKFQNGQRQLHVALRTRFDETTISPQRPKDASLTPNSRQVLLIDREGRAFAPVGTAGTSLEHNLIPGEFYETDLIFQLPAGTEKLRLLITGDGWEEHFLIGDENSFGHKKTYLAVPTTEVLSRKDKD
jgi:hypothetical protein